MSKTMKIELNVQTLAALTKINRTSINSIFKRGEEKYNLVFEKDSRGKIVYREQDFELLKKIQKLKDKHKYTYEQALDYLYEAGELKTHLTPEPEKNSNPTTESSNLVSMPAAPVQQMKIEFQSQPPLAAPNEIERQRILEQIQDLENFLHFVKNDVQTSIQRLYHSIDVKFLEKSKELGEMKETLSKPN